MRKLVAVTALACAALLLASACGDSEESASTPTLAATQTSGDAQAPSDVPTVSPSPTVSPTPTPAAPPSLINGPASVSVCREDQGWTRPTVDEMDATVWRDNRYIDASGSVPPQLRAYHERHFVIFTTVTASGAGHALDLTGLHTELPFAPGELCGSEYSEDLIEGRNVVVWAFGHSVKSAEIDGKVLAITVEPNAWLEEGYTLFYVARPQFEDWSVGFLLPEGRQIASASLFGGVTVADEPGLSSSNDVD